MPFNSPGHLPLDAFSSFTRRASPSKDRTRFTALLAKQLDVKPRGWTTVVGDYGKKGYRSVADVVDAESLGKVRAFKKQKKAAAAAG